MLNIHYKYTYKKVHKIYVAMEMCILDLVEFENL